MNSFLYMHKIIEEILYKANDKIAKISKKDPGFQQRYELIKSISLQKISYHSEALKNSSNKLFNLIFCSLYILNFKIRVFYL